MSGSLSAGARTLSDPAFHPMFTNHLRDTHQGRTLDIARTQMDSSYHTGISKEKSPSARHRDGSILYSSTNKLRPPIMANLQRLFMISKITPQSHQEISALVSTFFYPPPLLKFKGRIIKASRNGPSSKALQC